MLLTTPLLEQFVFGQLEIQNEAEGYVFRGEIDDAYVENNHVWVEFMWRGENSYPPLPNNWIRCPIKIPPYSASLEHHSASDIGDDRIQIISEKLGEKAVFYPPGYGNFNESSLREAL